tara:strand:+ start:2191 stop:2517 length:327 start_codon:yes stop_codon:yes gene_type:complete
MSLGKRGKMSGLKRCTNMNGIGINELDLHGVRHDDVEVEVGKDNSSSLFPTIPTQLLEEWFNEFCEIELGRLDTKELIKMDEDETYNEGMMSELFGRWVIWMKDMGFN